MNLDNIYEEKVYSGVLGKIIGVYLGRPFEQWTYNRILKELGYINYYVNTKLNIPLHVTDDDITGTFTFLRSLKDFNYNKNITPKQIGQTWINNLIEGQTILWWGGKGHSTEHTAYQNLKENIQAPLSGSIKINGKAVAEQIGAQIFIDGWALISPGDPEQAVYMAKKAASVSHDGEAIYGAQIIAAIEALAFIEKDISKIIEDAKKFIPKSSTIFQLISDIQEWRSKNCDWEVARKKIEKKYGYDQYPGECHIIPNHALIIMSLLFGDDSFQKTLMIVNTSGWDTDCNSGNVGCILGIKNGLDSLKEKPNYLSPVNDIIYCPTAVGGDTITDALRESFKIINIARNINGMGDKPVKNGARYHFEMPYSTQGWKVKSHKKENTLKISNVIYESKIGKRALSLEFNHIKKHYRSEVYVDTFLPEHAISLKGLARKKFFGYKFISCPIIYSGQEIKLEIVSKSLHNLNVNLFIKYWGKDDKLVEIITSNYTLEKSETKTISWIIPSTSSNPIGQLGLIISSNSECKGNVLLNYLKISGEPKQKFIKPDHLPKYQKGVLINEKFYGEMWKNSWVNAVDSWDSKYKNFRITKNSGRGLISIGTDIWKNYTVNAKIIFQLVTSGGLIARYQGLSRYYSLELTSNRKLRLIKIFYEKIILEEIDFEFDFFKEFNLSLKVKENNLQGLIDGKLVIQTTDRDNILERGGIGLLVENGTLSSNEIKIN